MKRIYSYALILSVFLISCEANNNTSVTIQGEVNDGSSGNGIAGAALIINSPAAFSGTFTSTDSSGSYLLDNIEITEATQFSITASQNGYISSEKTITALPEQVINLNFDLDAEGTDTGGGDTGSGGGGEVVGEPGIPAAIILENVSETAINIRQTGGTVNSTFSFVVQDSSGRNMNEDTPVEVNFQIIKGPNGGESVVPQRVETNASGVVVSNLFSGDSAGVVRMEAYIIRDDGVRISSTPILIAINGGFPAPDRFYVAPRDYNVEGYGYLDSGTQYPITASVGDRYGNPVKVGTAVDFRTDAGRIDGSALTDNRGFASVDLSPDGSTPGIGTADVGFFTITAKTVDENNDYIERDVLMLFTTRTANITFTSGSFDIPSNGSDNVNFTVTDLNGRPMAARTSIVVESLGDIEVSGDVDVILGDYFTTGVGKTDFTVTLKDGDDQNNSTQNATLTVIVTTPNGNITRATISGTRAKVIGN